MFLPLQVLNTASLFLKPAQTQVFCCLFWGFFAVTNNEIWHEDETVCYVSGFGMVMIYCPLLLMKAHSVNSL